MSVSHALTHTRQRLGLLAALALLMLCVHAGAAERVSVGEVTFVQGAASAQQPGQPLPTTSPLGSGFFLYVSIGAEATRCVEIPFRGSVSIRRGHTTERPAQHELILQDPAVSRSLHCTVTRVGRKLMLEDRSKNGTIVDGQHYLQQRAELRVNSIIRVGKTSIRVQAEGQVRPTTQGDE